MAASLRISAYSRMTLRPSGQVVLFTPERAYAAVLRQWGEQEAKRVALAVVWGRYGEDDAREELAGFLAGEAVKAKITGVSCRELAASMLADELAALDARHLAVLQEMIAVVRGVLQTNPEDFETAAAQAAAIARANDAPGGVIRSAMRIAVRAP